MDEGIFERIEHPQYSAMVNLASSYKQFVHALQMMPEATSLMNLANISAEYREAVLTRLDQVCRRKIEERYENPWDAALATYLWVLLNTDTQRADNGVNRVRSCPNCWWSKKLADEAKERVSPAMPLTAVASAGGVASPIDPIGQDS